MKILKVILIIIVSIAVVIAIVGLILPSNAHMERTKVLKSPSDAIFNQINDLKNWHSWMPWYRMDKNMQVTWGDKTSGEGANYSWNSKVVGNGKVIISKIVPTESVETAMDFDENGKGTSTYTLYKMDNGTKVTWSFDCDMGANPFKKAIGTLMMKMMMRPSFDQGLLWIDSAAAVAPPMPPPLKVEQVTHPAINYLAIRDTATMATISMKIGQGYGLIGPVMKKQKLNMAGALFVIYYTPPPVFDMDIAAAVDQPAKSDGKIRAGTMNSGPAIVVHYFGSYSKMQPAYSALQDWMKQNNKKASGPPWEVYITDPMSEKDTAKWQTDVYYPL